MAQRGSEEERAARSLLVRRINRLRKDGYRVARICQELSITRHQYRKVLDTQRWRKQNRAKVGKRLRAKAKGICTRCLITPVSDDGRVTCYICRRKWQINYRNRLKLRNQQKLNKEGF